jgi:hypothetical protein
MPPVPVAGPGLRRGTDLVHLASFNCICGVIQTLLRGYPGMTGHSGQPQFTLEGHVFTARPLGQKDYIWLLRPWVIWAIFPSVRCLPWLLQTSFCAKIPVSPAACCSVLPLPPECGLTTTTTQPGFARPYLKNFAMACVLRWSAMPACLLCLIRATSWCGRALTTGCRRCHTGPYGSGHCACPVGLAD